MKKATRVQVVIQLDTKTGEVVTSAPMSHPDVALGMIASALNQISTEIADARKDRRPPGSPRSGIVQIQ